MAGDPGLFGPDSVTWRIHSDASTLVGGLCALLVQAVDSRAMAGVAEHSALRTDPWGRLARTIEYVTTVTFGTTEEAWAAGRAVQRIHEHVTGIDPYSGRPYDANDPDLLEWVHNVLVHCTIVAYRRYGGRLSEVDADRYVVEQHRAAEVVGLPPDRLARTAAEVEAYVRHRKGVRVTPEARRMAFVILNPPMPRSMRPLWTVAAAGALTILPPHIRRMYWIPRCAPADAAVRVAVFGLLKALTRNRPEPPAIKAARERVAA